MFTKMEHIEAPLRSVAIRELLRAIQLCNEATAEGERVISQLQNEANERAARNAVMRANVIEYTAAIQRLEQHE
jgi:hypothetical protein